MKRQNLQVGKLYATAHSSSRHFLWKLLEFKEGGSRVIVQRADKPRLTVEVPATDFASLVEPVSS